MARFERGGFIRALAVTVVVLVGGGFALSRVSPKEAVVATVPPPDLAQALPSATASSAVVGPPRMVTSSPAWLSPDARRRAEQLTSLFESGSLEPRYEYSAYRQDGRGLTLGRGGFTSASGDMLEVVRRYAARSPGNSLDKYLKRLEALAASRSVEVTGLEGLPSEWQTACGDPAFRTIQDAVLADFYYKPAMRHGDEVGLRTALGRAIVYDTIVQHGNGHDPDGLPTLLASASQEVKGDPTKGIDEKAWVRAFLQERRANMAHARNPMIRDVWSRSVGRIDVLIALEKSGNWDLKGPIKVDDGGFKAVIP